MRANVLTGFSLYEFFFFHFFWLEFELISSFFFWWRSHPVWCRPLLQSEGKLEMCQIPGRAFHKYLIKLRFFFVVVLKFMRSWVWSVCLVGAVDVKYSTDARRAECGKCVCGSRELRVGKVWGTSWGSPANAVLKLMVLSSILMCFIYVLSAAKYSYMHFKELMTFKLCTQFSFNWPSSGQFSELLNDSSVI